MITAARITAGTNQPGDFIGQALNRCAAALRLRDHLDDLREHGFAADTLRFDDNAAGLIDGAAGHAITAALLDRHWLAGDHRLIDAGFAFEHSPVHRHFVARTNAEPVAFSHFIEWNVALFAIANDARSIWRQPEQRADCAAGATARAQFQHLPEQHQAR